MRKVTAEDAKQFAQVWKHNGVSIVFQDVHLQYAADFANIAVQSFIDEAQRLNAANAAKAAAAAKPKIITEGV